MKKTYSDSNGYRALHKVSMNVDEGKSRKVATHRFERRRVRENLRMAAWADMHDF